MASGNRLLLGNLASDQGRGYGAEMYRGEGGLASAGQYHNALAPFLGPPTKRIDADPQMQFPHEAWFLPGQNRCIPPPRGSDLFGDVCQMPTAEGTNTSGIVLYEFAALIDLLLRETIVQMVMTSEIQMTR